MASRRQDSIPGRLARALTQSQGYCDALSPVKVSISIILHQVTREEPLTRDEMKQAVPLTND